MDLAFDLSHPALVVAHQAAGDAAPIWAVNFNGTVRHHPAASMTQVLRHFYGTVTAATSGSLTVTKVYPAWPVASPETVQPSTPFARIFADATQGVLFQDLDAGTGATLPDFTTVAGTLPGRFVRIAVRYQEDGTLAASRVWAGNAFDSVFAGPEGHVLHVDPAADLLTATDPRGTAETIRVSAETRFFQRVPSDAAADTTPSAPALPSWGLASCAASKCTPRWTPPPHRPRPSPWTSKLPVTTAPAWSPLPSPGAPLPRP